MNSKTSFKKKKIIAFLLAATLALSGCSNDKYNSESSVSPSSSEVQTTSTAENNSSALSWNLTFTPEDDHQALAGSADENILLETDEGIFYSAGFSKGPNLYYYDKSTDKSIFLCNKPECPHDGNEFCAATNSKYYVLGRVAYNDKIVMLATEENSTQTQFKILIASLDGSKLEEYLTFYTVDSYGLSKSYSSEKSLIIHRNKLFARISLISNDSMSLTDAPVLNGLAIIDLTTKEFTFLDETPLDEDNPLVQNMRGQGNYIFFSTIADGKPAKKTLCRYNVTTGETEKYNPQGFKGTFAVLDEDQIAYCRPSSKKVTIYSISTNVSKDYMVTYLPPQYIPEHTITVHDPLSEDGSTDYEEIIAAGYTTPSECDFSLIFADENHIYVSKNSPMYVTPYFLETIDYSKDKTTIYTFTDYVWRFDKDLAHYTESDTAFTAEGEDGSIFGKQPGNEFEYVQLSSIIIREDTAISYEISVLKDKVILSEILASDDVITDIIYYSTSHDSFFSGTPEWEPYLHY